jgi:NhaP-type Na+/H+ or K+/H+ antiporter
VGEALLNDGMALVLFEALITPEYDTSLKILYYFVRVIFISPLLGLVMGLGTVIDMSVSAQLHECLGPFWVSFSALRP